ncbi:MAG: GntR family transcriptional regulator [Eubacteriaceae bacterium]|nr:GntR family transcriptional regulator [Clostridiales bacterium]MDD7719613.1 GntR family transcriptional regulator [Eubacteriaceae bacterium]
MEKNLQENVPIYMQIMNKVREAIASGELAPGMRVASVRELAGEFEVNPNTMQRALNELEREGLLVSERTSGRFVTNDTKRISELKIRMASETADRFRKEMTVLGYSESEMIDFFLKRGKAVSEKVFDHERIG